MTNTDLGWITNFIWGIADDVLRDQQDNRDIYISKWSPVQIKSGSLRVER